MPDYSFEQLSPYDFEVLSRDILQDAIKVRLESFKTGRDQGIDFRYATADTANSIVVQCKHYRKSGLSKLIGAIKKELPKLKVLDPERYILTTSVGLTPANKTTILNLLSPYVASTEDIWGADDLNNALGLNGDLEKKALQALAR
jgi:hypothetical protein